MDDYHVLEVFPFLFHELGFGEILPNLLYDAYMLQLRFYKVFW